MLVVLPLVLVRFDVEEVAVWQLFSVLFTLSMLLDFGLSPTFARLLSYARGGASVASMARPSDPAAAVVEHAPADSLITVFSVVRWLYARLAVVATVLFGVFGTAALLTPISQIADPSPAWAAWVLVLATMGIGFWGNGFGAAMQGMDRIAVMRRWEIGCGLAQVACSTAVLLLGGNLLALVASYQFWVVFNALRNRALIKRSFPELMAVPARADHNVLRVLWPATWRSGVGVLMSQGLIQASGVIYSQFGAPIEVAAYLLALRVITVISQFSAAPFYSKLPELARLHVSGETARQVAVAQRGMRLAHVTFVLGTCAVALLAQPLLQAIGSRTAFVPQGVWALMSLAFFAERFGAMHLQLYSVTNHIVWHIANGVTGVLMLAIAVASYGYIGAYAFPAAMLLAYAGFYCVYAVYHSRVEFGFRVLRFESRSAIPAVAVLCGVLLAVTFRRP